MKETGKFLRRLLKDTEREVAQARKRYNIGDLKRRTKDVPPLRSFHDALNGSDFGLIAEVKRKSPSQGAMSEENVQRAPAAYNQSRLVHAVSVLTNQKHFGMSIERLQEIKEQVRKPVLRKDFIFSEFQVYEARAFGADAILLMANVLEADEMKRLFERASELGMDVLFESHTKEEIESIPEGAKIYGINSRRFESIAPWFRFGRFSKWLVRKGIIKKDLSTEAVAFNLVKHLPSKCVKVAESGVRPTTIERVRRDGFTAVLIGTSLLIGPESVDSVLARFEDALSHEIPAGAPVPALAS